ncbi:interleukin-17D [Thalassophryne amazonica]|uniref:interleukin-17D n=1 Tax=Thalassophryne amazonica TaxID=390379 RepID=UPI001471BDB3|nr:interleukin-17D [Thalassophryne amazonica]
MSVWIRVLLMVHLGALQPGGPSGTGQIRKNLPRRRPCLEPPEEVLEQMFGRLSVGVFSAFHHALQLEPHDKLNLSCPTTTRLTSDCKKRLPLNLLSVAPWAYRLSYDPTRYPRYIPEAYCLCKGCLIGPHGEDEKEYRSTPVYAPSVILKRTGSCVGGRHSYAETYVSIAVGCTCVPLLEGEPHGRNSSKSLHKGEVKGRKRGHKT